jgi:hypothetical protein
VGRTAAGTWVTVVCAERDADCTVHYRVAPSRLGVEIGNGIDGVALGGASRPKSSAHRSRGVEGEHASRGVVVPCLTNEPDAFAVQAKDFTNRIAQVKAFGGDLEEKFQEIVAAWLEEQTEKARRVSDNP